MAGFGFWELPEESIVALLSSQSYFLAQFTNVRFELLEKSLSLSYVGHECFEGLKYSQVEVGIDLAQQYGRCGIRGKGCW